MEKPTSSFNGNNTGSQAPRALVIWPEGLSERPQIFPLGATDAETDSIRRHLERALEQAGWNHA